MESEYKFLLKGYNFKHTAKDYPEINLEGYIEIDKGIKDAASEALDILQQFEKGQMEIIIRPKK